MALIKCPECRKEISDKSPQCIHCGYPLNTETTLPSSTNSTASEKKYKVLLVRYEEAEKSNTIKLISDLTNLSLDDAAEFVENCPRYVLSNISQDEFTLIEKEFTDIGAAVQCEEMTESEFLYIPTLSPTYFSKWKECPTCGKSISKNAVSCPFCGHTLVTENERSGLGFWGIVGAVIVAIIIMSFL